MFPEQLDMVGTEEQIKAVVISPFRDGPDTYAVGDRIKAHFEYVDTLLEAELVVLDEPIS